MRSALAELPVLLCLLRGGLTAGAAAALIRLPRRLCTRRLKGRRAGALPLALFILLDAAAAFGTAAVFALSLLYANGGEPRLYAVLGFAAGAALSAWAVRALTA
ncbi:MAG: hypothetical protein J5586_04175 [Clostridia bacterium]|nr:hypothetical protein [Clostridia bacterium]